jgi:hypothetical protein
MARRGNKSTRKCRKRPRRGEALIPENRPDAPIPKNLPDAPTSENLPERAGPYELPPLTPEQLREQQDSRKARKAIDRYIAIRDNQIPPPWQSQPAARSKSKAGPGAERQYEHGRIRAVAKEVRKTGTDEHRSWFYDRVRETCRVRHIKAPKNNRTMGRIIGDLY